MDLEGQGPVFEIPVEESEKIEGARMNFMECVFFRSDPTTCLSYCHAHFQKVLRESG